MRTATEPAADGRPSRRHRVVLDVASRRSTEFIDITDRVAQAAQAVGLRDGAVLVHTRHTTTGLLVNEHEPLLLQDLERFFARLAPAGDAYAHDDFGRRSGPLAPDERRNAHAHCRAALLRQFENLLVADGDLYLGRWQRLFLVDFDGPQSRQVVLTFLWIAAPAARAIGGETD